MTSASDKTTLRSQYRARRKELSSADLLSRSLKIAEQVKALDLKGVNNCHVFMSIEHLREVDTQAIVAYLQSIHKQVVVPRTIPQSVRMQHFILTPDMLLTKNSYHIPEPVGGKEVQPYNIDLVFVPLLAFDLHGNRVGYGKGYYDVFLAECRSDTLKIGLSFFDPEQEILDVSPMDVRLDSCITPCKIYSF